MDDAQCAGVIVSEAAGQSTAVIYTHSLLEPSMTFILSHAEALRTYVPVYAGAHAAHGLVLPQGRMFVANNGGWRGRIDELMFRRFGRPGRLAASLCHFKPDIVHAHFGQSGPAGLCLAEALNVPLIVTYHGNDATITVEEARRSWRGREYLRGRARVMARASLIIAVSDFIRQRLLEKGYPAERVVTHRNGIDLNAFRNAGETREPVIAFVGRFVEKKGCEYLLRALGRLDGQGRRLRAVLMGDGPLRAELELLAGQVNCDVEFTGFLPITEVRNRLGKASVLAVPSVTAADGDSEGLPTVILEAQAMGIPVVATRHAGNAEGVVEGRSARLVDERDVEGLAEALLFFIDNPAAVESFGAAGRAFVEANFSITKQVEGLERLYDQARRLASVRSVRSEPCPA